MTRAWGWLLGLAALALGACALAPVPPSGPLESAVRSPVRTVAAVAPDFVLFDVVGEAPYALGERRGGWVVLHFFPRADTPDCACDATVFTEHLWRFGDAGVEVACVTLAPEADARRYAKKYGLRAPLLPDPTLAVAEAYGAVDFARADPIRRTSVIVDPTGLVRARFDDIVGTDHVETLLGWLAAHR